MITAAKICSVLNVSDFELNYKYCELLRSSRYPDGNPIPMLEVATNSISQMKQKFTELEGFNYNLDILGAHRMSNRFPESEQDGKDRVRENVEQQ